MKYLALMIVFLINFQIGAQPQHDETISALIKKYTSKLDLACEIFVQADVEGMHIPDKTILVEFKENGKPKVTGKGLALLPKKGMINQFRELLLSPMQAIYLSKRNDNLVYKLVSLDPNSDWITADIVFDESSLLIYESTITTRKYGAFNTSNVYENSMYPSKSVITFNVKKFKVPLKFIGRTLNAADQPELGEEVIGKITLNYTYL